MGYTNNLRKGRIAVLLAVYTIIIVLLSLPLLAEIRMVIRSILYASVGSKAGQQLLRGLPFIQRLTLHGLSSHLKAEQRAYSQYLRLQLAAVAATAAAVLLEVLFINLRQAVPALVVCLVYCVCAFGGISLVHAHAGYDPEKHTTRYDRSQK